MPRRMTPEDLGQDNPESMTLHYRRTVQSGRLPDLKLFHYADMIRDRRRAVNCAVRIGTVGVATVYRPFHAAVTHPVAC